MTDVAPTSFLTPAQKQWLFMFLAVLLSALLTKYLPGAVAPLPPELPAQVAETAAAVKRLEAGQEKVMKAAGIPPAK